MNFDYDEVAKSIEHLIEAERPKVTKIEIFYVDSRGWRYKLTGINRAATGGEYEKFSKCIEEMISHYMEFSNL